MTEASPAWGQRTSGLLHRHPTRDWFGSFVFWLDKQHATIMSAAVAAPKATAAEDARSVAC